MQELSGSLKGAAGGIESLFQPVASSDFPKGKAAGKQCDLRKETTTLRKETNERVLRKKWHCPIRRPHTI